MTYFMHYTNQRPDALIQAAITQAKALARNQFSNLAFNGEFPKTGYGITTIRPYHIQAGGTYWGSSNYWASCFAAANTWEAWIDITQTDLAFEIVTGFQNLEAVPKEVEIYVEGDGNQMPTINIEEIYSMDVSRAFFAKPLIFSPEKAWAYYHKGSDTGIEREALLGYTLGTRAFLILRN